MGLRDGSKYRVITPEEREAHEREQQERREQLAAADLVITKAVHGFEIDMRWREVRA